jgi:RNA polymerase sigma-70 factor (ECF subfamily)
LTAAVSDTGASDLGRLIPLRSDEALVSALREGRSDAAAAIFERYAVYVCRVLVRVLGRDPEVGDLVQDVFVVALESIAKLDEARALQAWLTQIAIFSAKNRIRRRRRWRRILSFVPSHELPDQPQAAIDYESSEALLAVYRTLGRLDADERSVFSLRFIDGRELNDVAQTCHVSLATIKRRLSRARSSFREAARPEPARRERDGYLRRPLRETAEQASIAVSRSNCST